MKAFLSVFSILGSISFSIARQLSRTDRLVSPCQRGGPESSSVSSSSEDLKQVKDRREAKCDNLPNLKGTHLDRNERNTSIEKGDYI